MTGGLRSVAVQWCSKKRNSFFGLGFRVGDLGRFYMPFLGYFLKGRILSVVLYFSNWE